MFEYVISGQTVGVLANSTEFMVTNKYLHATPVIYEDHESLITAVRAGEVVAALMDRNVASYFVKNQNIKDLIIEREIDVEMKIRMFLHYNSTALPCEEDEYEEDWYADETQSILSDLIPPLRMQKMKVRSLNEIFDDTDGGIMKVTTIITASIVTLAFLYEFVSYVKGFITKKEQHLEM